MATKVTESAYKPMPEDFAKGFKKPSFREDPVAWLYGIQKAPSQIGIQVTKTSLQKIPYLPMFETARTPALPSRLFGSAISFLAAAPKRKAKVSPTPLEAPKPFVEEEQKEKAKPSPAQESKTHQKPETYQKTETFQKTQTFQKTVAKTVGIQLTQPRKPKLPPKLGRKKKRKRKTMAPIFGWVRLEWPVAGPEKVLETVIGGKKRK